MLKLLFALSFVFVSQLTFAFQAPLDLGDDIMHPMGVLFKQIGTDITDGTKNAATVENIKKIEALIEQALAVDPTTKSLILVPDTVNYKSEEALVGPALALKKYAGLMQALRVTMLEFELTVSAAKANACGQPCTDKMKDLKSIQDAGHSVFKDKH